MSFAQEGHDINRVGSRSQITQAPDVNRNRTPQCLTFCLVIAANDFEHEGHVILAICRAALLSPQINIEIAIAYIGKHRVTTMVSMISESIRMIP